MEISELLTNFRKSSKMSQKEFAELLGVPQTTWAGYELGKSEPKLSTLLLLAQKGFFIPELSEGSAKPVLDSISDKTGLTHDEIVKQRFEQLSDFPLDTPLSELPKATYKKPNSKATEKAAIAMLETAIKTMEAAVKLLRENVEE